jgi:multisubunit Na+/H+ antiporter MnhG subunit
MIWELINNFLTAFSWAFGALVAILITFIIGSLFSIRMENAALKAQQKAAAEESIKTFEAQFKGDD